MIRLQTFGTLDLRGPRGELRSVLTQPKRLGLLVRLAAELPGSFLRRDTLLAMFWPELDMAGARNALRQALFHLRKELGEGVLVNRGDDEIGLDPARIRADVMDFEAAAAAGRWRDALELVHGEFAPALFVGDAGPFEEWLEGRRQAIRRRAEEGAWALVAEAEAAGHPAVAAGWARRAVEFEPENEVAVRRLIRLLMAAGDSGGAAQAYASLEERLRRDYDTAPSPETQALRHLIPHAGAVVPAPVAASPAAVPPAAPPVASAASGGAPRGAAARWRWLSLALAVVAVLGVTGVWLGRRASASGSAAATLLIAPFRSPAGDSGLAALAIGLVDLTAARLSGDLPFQPVDPDVGLRAVAESDGSGEGSESERLRLAARRTGAGVILTGTLMRQGGRLIAAPLLVDAATGEATSLAVLSASPDSLPWLVDRVASALLATVSATDSLDAPTLSAIPLPALRAYLRGREAMRQGRVEEAIGAFGLALELDSTFALAARDYAEALDWAGSDPDAQAMQRAWALRSGLGARDHALLVALAGRRFPALTPVRERVEDWEIALRLAPDRARAWFGLGDVLFHLGDVAGIPDAQGRARAAFDRALMLDSASAPALLHRIEMAAREGDLPTIRRLAPRAEGPTVPGDAAQFLRWRIALALGDSAARQEVLAALDTLSPLALYRIAGWAQLDGAGVEDAGLALAALRLQPRTGEETARLLAMGTAYESNAGRPAASRALYAAAGHDQFGSTAVLFAASPGTAAEEAALAAAVAEGRIAGDLARREVMFVRLWSGEPFDSAEARRYLADLDRRGDAWYSAYTCLLAARLGEGDAALRLRRADSVMNEVTGASAVAALPPVLARCHEALGDRRGALQALSRRPLDATYGPVTLAGALYDEGRLALLAQDRPRALRAWRHFLALRHDPEPALVPQRDSIQRLVDSLARP